MAPLFITNARVDRRSNRTHFLKPRDFVWRLTSHVISLGILFSCPRNPFGSSGKPAVIARFKPYTASTYINSDTILETIIELLPRTVPWKHDRRSFVIDVKHQAAW